MGWGASVNPRCAQGIAPGSVLRDYCRWTLWSQGTHQMRWWEWSWLCEGKYLHTLLSFQPLSLCVQSFYHRFFVCSMSILMLFYISLTSLHLSLHFSFLSMSFFFILHPYFILQFFLLLLLYFTSLSFSFYIFLLTFRFQFISFCWMQSSMSWVHFSNSLCLQHLLWLVPFLPRPPFYNIAP